MTKKLVVILFIFKKLQSDLKFLFNILYNKIYWCHYTYCKNI